MMATLTQQLRELREEIDWGSIKISFVEEYMKSKEMKDSVITGDAIFARSGIRNHG